MTHATPPDPRLRLLALWGLPGIVVASHLGWLWRDTRMPTDLSLFWAELPALAAALSGTGQVPWDALSAPGGWLQLAMAVVQVVAGPSALLFQLGDVLWVGILMVSLTRLVDRAEGPRAAVAVGAVVGLLPATVVYARMGWLHVPEAALVTGAAAVWWCAAPGWVRTVVVAGMGALAMALRPSALVWLAPLAVVLVRSRAPWPIALAWGLGALPALFDLPAYLDAKLAARDRYTTDVPALLEQLPGLVGGLGGLLLVVGCMLLAVRARRGRGSPALFVTALHAATPVGLFLLFRAGLDNFTQGFVALAVLAGVGLSVSRWTTGLAVGAFALFTGLQHVPPPPPALSPVVAPLQLPMQMQLRNAWRPFVGWSADDLRALLSATCPDAPCVLATDRSLARPDGEEPGQLVLYLLDLDHRVQLVDLRTMGHQLPRHIDVLLRFDCPTLETAWIRRYPDSLALRAQIVDHFALQDAWVRGLDHQCAIRWMTHHGRLPHAEAAPPGEHLPRLGPEPSVLEHQRRRPGSGGAP